MTNEPDMPDDERPSLGEEIISWIEANCRVPEGALVGQPVVLMQWQRNAIIKSYDNRVPTRRAIISVGRKSGKTATAAFLLLYSTAQSRDQAKDGRAREQIGIKVSNPDPTEVRSPG